ncbi:hypothetical protein CDV55_100646 [Aspergillus turcosus]|nr:hypothetical protein CDV55_100646 [Aspergillus turcosus]
MPIVQQSETLFPRPNPPNNGSVWVRRRNLFGPALTIHKGKIVCEQAGYNGDDEGEARTSKNQDIVFLDQETRLSLLVKVDGVIRNLNGGHAAYPNAYVT